MGFIFDIEMLVINIYYKASISNSRKNENFLDSFIVLFYTSFSPLVYCFVLFCFVILSTCEYYSGDGKAVSWDAVSFSFSSALDTS